MLQPRPNLTVAKIQKHASMQRFRHNRKSTSVVMWLDFVLVSIKLRNLKWPASKFQRGWIRTRCTLKYEMLNTDQSCLPSVKLSWVYLLNWVKISFSDSEHVIASWFTSSCRAKHFFWKNNCSAPPLGGTSSRDLFEGTKLRERGRSKSPAPSPNPWPLDH